MENGNNLTSEERIAKGITITQSAIENSDAAAVRSCIHNFRKLGATPEKMLEAVQNCPMSLAGKAGIAVTIESAVLGRRITIGKDISWEEVAKLCESNVTGDSLKTVMFARDEFNGKIESITPAEQTEQPPAEATQQPAPEPARQQEEAPAEEPGLFPDNT